MAGKAITVMGTSAGRRVITRTPPRATTTMTVAIKAIRADDTSAAD
jgi:hypothetical protein